MGTGEFNNVLHGFYREYTSQGIRMLCCCQGQPWASAQSSFLSKNLRQPAASRICGSLSQLLDQVINLQMKMKNRNSGGL